MTFVFFLHTSYVLLSSFPVCNQWNVLLKLVNVQRKNTPELMNDGIWCELIVCALHQYASCSIRWGLHVVNRIRTSCYFSWKRCWLFFSYHGEFSHFQVSKYLEYSTYTGCISLYIYCLITCYIKSLLNVPKISHISRKISQVSRFPAKSPDSRNKFVFLPKQPLLELSPPVFFC